MLALLAVLSVCNVHTDSRALQAIQAFSALTSLPALAFIGGRLSQSAIQSWKQVCSASARLTAWFLSGSVLSFWLMIAAREKGGLNVLCPQGAGGALFLAALALLAVGQVEQSSWKRTWVLFGAVAVSVFSGYVPFVPNLFGIRQLLAFLPLFLAGRWMNGNELDKLLKKASAKVATAVLTLGTLGLCFWKGSRLLAWESVLQGYAGYSATGSRLLTLGGGALRLGQLVLGLLLAAGWLSLTPKAKLPVLGLASRHWYTGFVLYPAWGWVMSALPLRGTVGAVLRLVLLAVVPVLVCATPVNRLVLSLSRLPNLMVREEAFQIGKNRRILSVYVRYSVLFLLMISVFFSGFAVAGKSLIWIPDGENLYLTIMYYTRDYIVNAVENFLSTGLIVLPQWDFSIGQGAGVLSVLHLNPFFLLALIFPRTMMEQVYALTIVLQLYLTGMLFLRFCLAIKKEQSLPILMGALLYTFSGFGIFTASKHIYFITYLLMGLPLLLLACERWLQDKKCGMMLAVVVFLFCGSYYYMWMDSFLMALYLLAREIYVHKNDVKRIALDLLQLIGLYLWGFALSMVIFLPSAMNLFGSSRSDTLGTGAKLLYSARHYEQLITFFATLRPDAQNWTRLGFVCIVLFALVVLFLTRTRRELLPLKMMSVVFALFLCSPAMGSLFNGFGYSSNRWSFGFAFLMALVVVYVFRDLVCLPRKHRKSIAISAVIYSVVVLALDHSKHMLVSIALLAGFAAALTGLNHLRDKQLAQRLLALLTVVALMCHIGYYYSEDGLNQAESFLKRGTAAKNMRVSAEAVSTGLDDSLYRAENAGNRHNAFCLTGGNGTSSYWSVLDGNMVDYYLDFDLDSVRQSYALWGLDQRASLCALASVKYYAGDNADAVPYGYTLRDDIDLPEDTAHRIYENQYALPFGYAYDSYIDEQTYATLSPLEKQQALLQGALVTEENETAVSSSLTPTQLNLTAQSIPFTVMDAENVELHGTTFEVSKDGGSVTLSFEGLPDCETYLYLKAVDYNGKADDSKVTVTSERGVNKASNIYEKGTLYSFDRNGYTYLLGYQQDGMTSCSITFESKGTYAAEEIQIVCLPMSDYRADVTALGQNVLTEARETPSGGLAGSITLESSRLVAFSVPWSKGWTLTVNGEKADLIQVNKMYCGVVLPSGHYELELHYTAPGLMLGAAVTGVALVAVLGYSVFCLLRAIQRKNKQA